MRPLFQQTLTPFWTPHQVRGDIVRIGVRGDTLCSFFSTARRTNQEAPPLLSGRSEAGAVLGGCGTRCVRQSSPSYLGRLASSRPDKGGGYHRDGKEARHSALRREIQEFLQEIT
ncbi:hypothetical protein [Barnesiella viscericola]|uniref:hypothetical protein n=1 Tax=Barnesiella viscericola TaxID=397865 RepID=UPI00235739C5|nr:hypothetical protein [Barnesiella viscericola]